MACSSIQSDTFEVLVQDLSHSGDVPADIAAWLLEQAAADTQNLDILFANDELARKLSVSGELPLHHLLEDSNRGFILRSFVREVDEVARKNKISPSHAMRVVKRALVDRDKTRILCLAKGRHRIYASLRSKYAKDILIQIAPDSWAIPLSSLDPSPDQTDDVGDNDQETSADTTVDTMVEGEEAETASPSSENADTEPPISNPEDTSQDADDTSDDVEGNDGQEPPDDSSRPEVPASPAPYGSEKLAALVTRGSALLSRIKDKSEALKNKESAPDTDHDLEDGSADNDEVAINKTSTEYDNSVAEETHTSQPDQDATPESETKLWLLSIAIVLSGAAIAVFIAISPPLLEPVRVKIGEIGSSLGDALSFSSQEKAQQPDVSKHTSATVTARSLNVRKSPSLSAPVVGQRISGDRVIIYERSGTWSRIGVDQWVSTKFLNEESE